MRCRFVGTICHRPDRSWALSWQLPSQISCEMTADCAAARMTGMIQCNPAMKTPRHLVLTTCPCPVWLMYGYSVGTCHCLDNVLLSCLAAVLLFCWNVPLSWQNWRQWHDSYCAKAAVKQQCRGQQQEGQDGYLSSSHDRVLSCFSNVLLLSQGNESANATASCQSSWEMTGQQQDNSKDDSTMHCHLAMRLPYHPVVKMHRCPVGQCCDNLLKQCVNLERVHWRCLNLGREHWEQWHDTMPT